MRTFNPECVCGGSVDRPNDDCERCQLVAALHETRDQRDTLAEACRAFLGQLDYLRGLWGDEGVTRTIADKARHALSTLDDGEEDAS
jgi:hypothetical protein